MLPTPPTLAQALLGGRRRGPGNPEGVPRWIGGSELPPHGSGAQVVSQRKQTGRPGRN
jgi:hypothetical protein